jgi:hypothetical protein
MFPYIVSPPQNIKELGLSRYLGLFSTSFTAQITDALVIFAKANFTPMPADSILAKL